MSTEYGASCENFLVQLVQPENTIEEFSYIRHVSGEVGDGYAVCLADGTQLAVFPSHNAAYYTAIQFELNPQSVH